LKSRSASRRKVPASPPRGLEGELDASGLRFTLLCSRWNPTITDRLLASALEALRRHGARETDLRVVKVPGAFELPGAARMAMAADRSDALIALGAIIRGETNHHEILGHAVASALANLSAETGRPIGFGLLTCDTIEQARERIGKGADAAEAAIEMANLSRRRGTR